MARFDGTGPQGAGPMTGRGLGWCVCKAEEVLADREVRRGLMATAATAGVFGLGLARRLGRRGGRGQGFFGGGGRWVGRS